MSAKIGTWQKVTWYKFLQTLFQGRKSSEVQNLLQLFVSLVCIHLDSQVMFLMTDSFSLQVIGASWISIYRPHPFVWRHRLCLHHVVMNTWGFLYQETVSYPGHAVQNVPKGRIQDIFLPFQLLYRGSYCCYGSLLCCDNDTVSIIGSAVFDTMIIAS